MLLKYYINDRFDKKFYECLNINIMSYYTDQKLYDSKKYFFDEKLTCWMACLMSWTKNTPFDNNILDIDKFHTVFNNRKWFDNDEKNECGQCNIQFGLFNRRHHCRLCGGIFCGICSDIRNIKCCYRESLYIRSCHKCHHLFSERWNLFHELQKKWMASEGRISDCVLPNHPYFSEHLQKNLMPIENDDKPISSHKLGDALVTGKLIENNSPVPIINKYIFYLICFFIVVLFACY